MVRIALSVSLHLRCVGDSLLGGSARDGRLLNDDLGGGRNLGNSSGSELEVADGQDCRTTAWSHSL